MTTTLWLGGSVYSATMPDATAFAVTDSEISWVGSDAVGRALHPEAIVKELNGAFATPIFVDSQVFASSQILSQEISHGVTRIPLSFASVVIQTPQQGATVLEQTDATAIHYPEKEEINRERLLAHYISCTALTVQSVIAVVDESVLKAVVSVAAQLVSQFGGPMVARCSHRLEIIADSEVFNVLSAEQTAILATAGFSLCIQIENNVSAATNFALIARSGLGITFGVGSDRAVNPWNWIQTASSPADPEFAISPRAAFVAGTRGGWRASGDRYGLTGTLSPGAAAHFALWEVVELVNFSTTSSTQGSSIQRWSTDPRSRVPALPNLVAHQELPQCIASYLAGDLAWERGVS